MNITSKFGDIKSYIRELTDILWRYIHNIENYPKNALLAIQPELMTTVIDSRDACQKCDFYSITQLVERNSYGRLTPNRMAIERLAEKYYPNGRLS
ncbi:MAG: hypothetical protein I3J02_11855 [Prevotella sp.]|nr:hypothetical protein [Prevotella sp.]